MYVFYMVFMIPMGPGLNSSESSVNAGITTIKVEGYTTHFSHNPESIRAFLRSEDIIIECSNIIAQTNTQLTIQTTLPDTLPSNSWDLLVNAEKDGTLYLQNALFHEPAVSAMPEDLSFSISSINEEDIYKEDLDLHFPYQPRIIESIRNPNATRTNVVYNVLINGYRFCSIYKDIEEWW